MDFGVVLQTTPPVGRVVDLAKRAEAAGFSHVWVFDSHVLWQEPFLVLSQILAGTERITVGPMVTNPGTRDWTVLASLFATLNDVYGPRTICGIGRGDSALRYIGRKPRTLTEMTQAIRVVKGMVAGESVNYRGKQLRFPWLRVGYDLKMWGAGYGPRALDCIGRHADGFILQLADPQILEWTTAAVADAARAQGRDANSLSTCVVAPAYVGEDIAHQRDQLRWFGGMVGNHVADLVKRYGQDSERVPKALTDYIKRRQDYDYSHHGQAGNPSTQFVPDDIVDRFCVLGGVQAHISKLNTLRELGADQFAIYLMHDDEDATLDAYARSVLPAFAVQPYSASSANGAVAATVTREASKGYAARSGFGTRPALLIVDFINGFTDPRSGIGCDHSAALRVTAELLAAFRARALPVVFTTHVYEVDHHGAGPFLDKVPGLGVLTRGSQWVKVDQRIRPRADELIIEKQYASAFFATTLDIELKSRGVDTVIVAGCTTSGNVRASVLDAMQHGLRTLVVRDAVGDRCATMHEANLADIDAKYADVLTSAAVIDYLGAAGGGETLSRAAREDFRRWWYRSNSP